MGIRIRCGIVFRVGGLDDPSSSDRQERLTEDWQRLHLDTLLERKKVRSRIDDTSVWLEIVTGVIETPLNLRRETSLNLDCPSASKTGPIALTPRLLIHLHSSHS